MCMLSTVLCTRIRARICICTCTYNCTYNIVSYTYARARFACIRILCDLRPGAAGGFCIVCFWFVCFAMTRGFVSSCATPRCSYGDLITISPTITSNKTTYFKNTLIFIPLAICDFPFINSSSFFSFFFLNMKIW